MPIRWCDDLPAMDDDDLTRPPDLPPAFDEATAILTGDALQTLAFACCAKTTNCASNAPPACG